MKKRNYRLAHCKGIKKCSQCEHHTQNSSVRNTCPIHPNADLIQIEGCPVEFVYIFPENKKDMRRWTGGLCRSHNLQPSLNHHNHGAPASHNIPQFIRAKVSDALEVNPTLTTAQLSAGQGLPSRPGAADLSATHYGRLNEVRKNVLQKTGVSVRGVQIVMEMEKMADKIDQKDSEVEGSTQMSSEYAKLGRPYLQDYCITKDITYQFIMSPFMCQLLQESDFIEADTTYNENSELKYLFNCTAFDYISMRWMPVARMRGSVENSKFYETAFHLINVTCQKYHLSFQLGTSLRGIITDWSDTEAKGLHAVAKL